MSAMLPIAEGRKEACKTYLEQTKLLVTLASAFLIAPAGLVGIMKDRGSAGLKYVDVGWLTAAEVLFVVSVLLGYVAIGSLAGSQDRDEFDVYRPAVRFASLGQFTTYLLGLCIFVAIAVRLVA